MGNICFKTESVQQTEEEAKAHEENLIDKIQFPEYKLTKLLFLKNMDEKFNALKFICLPDFMSILNNIQINEPLNKGINRVLKFSNYLISKDIWIQLMKSKVLSLPSIPRIEESLSNVLLQYYDDVFDSLLRYYNFFFEVQLLVVPKVMITSFAFNYCNGKISQKVEIFLNLFMTQDNNIELTSYLYAFLYCIMHFAFDFPLKFINLYSDPKHVKEYFNIASTKDFEYLFDEDRRENFIREFFLRESKKIFGQNNDKKFTKDEFKNFLLDTSEKGGFWLLDNNLIRSRIENDLNKYF